MIFQKISQNKAVPYIKWYINNREQIIDSVQKRKSGANFKVIDLLIVLRKKYLNTKKIANLIRCKLAYYISLIDNILVVENAEPIVIKTILQNNSTNICHKEIAKISSNTAVISSPYSKLIAKLEYMLITNITISSRVQFYNCSAMATIENVIKCGQLPNFSPKVKSVGL